ncbi:hypothetical protein VBS42_17410 [Klebsiella pneumoniae]|uniref:hypothetical protein n=1 Tax=Klebsiella pneumoniae TaxID=573 RepID=UPI00103379EC|nr:hypothetical protein [Klebsiella pneumoniae]MEA4259900.1 hypothetical protein [Klebsiella pneumoniae]MEC6716978.1 hypothetical protein [Klebsiella pneumoniae]HBT4612171.1 hypothetical protein [Klebsiella pneumoniae]HBT4665957.1 hypothetical protein [Klebsiella pneumoniae]HCB0665138.1 hypothetical protein [Klebsiella pneumoniae]
MTTDITELAQSEINDALAQLKQISEYPTPSTQYARVLRKYIATLVEALENSESRLHEVAVACATAEQALEKAQQRIIELVARKEKRLPVPYAYLRESDGQIQISIGAERPSDRSGGYATPWFPIYTAAGIKVEAE